MVANKKRNRQSGQSMVEFAFMLPIIIGMLVLLRQINMAINGSIVNQKYSRALAHYLAFNHRDYPEAYFKSGGNGNWMRRWWVGVDDKSNYSAEDADNASPVAPSVMIGRKKGRDDDVAGSGDDVQSRAKVRVRSMAFICVPPYGGKLGEIFSEGALSEGQFSGSTYTYCED